MDYKAGARVRIVAEGTVDPQYQSGDDGDCVKINTDRGYFYIEVGEKLGPFVTVLADPLPTEPGVYVPANNSSRPYTSYLYILESSGVWKQYTTQGVVYPAKTEAVSAHERLGGLVPLGVVE
jgi:hypothetical protein